MFNIIVKYKISEKDFNNRSEILDGLKRKLNSLSMKEVQIVDDNSIIFKNSFGRLPNNWHIMTWVNHGRFAFVHEGRQFSINYSFNIPAFLYIGIAAAIVCLFLFSSVPGFVFFLVLSSVGFITTVYHQKRYFREYLS